MKVSAESDIGEGGLKLLPRRQLIHEAVRAEIKGYIVRQRLRAGDPLPTEGEFALQLGVSRNSVREAVKGLEGLGVIEARAGAGLFVRDFSLDALLDHLAFGMFFDLKSLSDILEVRQAVETGMATAVVNGRAETQLAALDAILDDWRLASKLGEYPPALDRAFHETLYLNIQNHLLKEILDSFWSVFNEARRHALIPEVDDPSGTLEVHLRIVEALRVGNAEQLMEALEYHHQGVKRRISDAIKAERHESDV